MQMGRREAMGDRTAFGITESMLLGRGVTRQGTIIVLKNVGPSRGFCQAGTLH